MTDKLEHKNYSDDEGEKKDKDFFTSPDLDAQKQEKWAQRYSIFYLSRYATSAGGLSEVLKRRAKKKFENITPHRINELAEIGVNFCRMHGAINDSRYAESKVNALMRKGKSSKEIELYLQTKGVSSSDIKSALLNYDEFSAADVFAKRKRIGKYRKYDIEVTREIKRKELNTLLQNRFSHDVCRAIVDEEIIE